MIYSTVKQEQYKMMFVNVMSFVYFRQCATPVKEEKTTRNIKRQKVQF